jgi:hypothetical protein
MAESVAQLSEKTADAEEANLEKVLETDAQAAERIKAAGSGPTADADIAGPGGSSPVEGTRPGLGQTPSGASRIGPGRDVPPDAAPFDQRVADQVPPYGTKGTKTTGILVLEDGRVLPPQDSGVAGPAQDIPKPRPGMNGNLVTHVEAHSVGAMRQAGVTEATLYINREPCIYPGPRPGEDWGCGLALPYMLRPGEKLTVYGPNGYVQVFRGRP